MGKHDKADPNGYPIGEPPGKRDGSREKPGKHAEDNPNRTKKDK